jgi:hypothetical protein
MKTKQIVILGTILIIVIVCVVLFEKLSSGPFDSKKASGKDAHFFPGYSIDNCSAFMVTDKSGSVKLKQKGGTWVVSPVENEAEEEESASIIEEDKGKDTDSGYPADSSSVATALDKITKLKKDELISTNPEKQSVLEVDTVKGTLVEVWDSQNKSLGKVIIGKNGPDWNSHFVRQMGTNDVYRVGESVKYSFFTDEKRWRDKTIIKFDKTFAKKITITKKDTVPVVLEKSTDTTGTAIWNITAPISAKTDSEIVTRIVDDLADVKTAEWETSDTLTDEDMGFTDPTLVVSVEMEDGGLKNLYVGNKKEDKSKYWVKTDGTDAIFLAYDSKFNNIRKPVEEIQFKEEEKKEE